MKQIYTFILLFALATTSNFTLLAQELEEQQDVEINSANKDLSITIGVYNNTLYILNAKENEKVDIMNMLGENVLSYIIMHFMPKSNAYLGSIRYFRRFAHIQRSLLVIIAKPKNFKTSECHILLYHNFPFISTA